MTAGAKLYSLIEAAKVNGSESYAFLHYLAAELSKADTIDAIDALLLGNLDANWTKIL